jgi:NAD(P)H-quinone oxidoreductase subunit 5
MPFDYPLMEFLGYVVITTPLLLLLLLGVSTLIGYKLSERTITESVMVAVVSGLVASLAILALMLTVGSRHVPIDLGGWVMIPGDSSTGHEEYSFTIKFVFDRLSVPFVILTFLLSGTIGAFAANYMHRERGFNRFFTLYALFVFGMVISSLAGNIETLFAGWEFVGLSSALLIAFFQERPAPPRNGLWVWVVYRVADAAFLIAAVVLMHMAGHGDFDLLTGARDSLCWPEGQATIAPSIALIVGLLLLIAAAGKSALVPFSGWLPRAMEGPTPSSAVFYGALSVHLGAFLLLRVGSLLDSSLWLAAAVIFLGLATAVYAYIAGSVQTDIKAALSFASVLQVGIIVAEIGVAAALAGIGKALRSPTGDMLAEIGAYFRYVPLIHILGHASLRTLQFVRAPTLLLDVRNLENAIGARLPRPGGPFDHLAPTPTRSWLYRFGLERGYLDTILADYVAAPFVWLFRSCDALERRWTDFLSGRESRESDAIRPYAGSFEDLP